MMDQHQIAALAAQINASGKHYISHFTVAASDGSRRCFLDGGVIVTESEFREIVRLCHPVQQVMTAEQRTRARVMRAAERT